MYSFSSKVRYSECDEHAQLSIVALINYLQDCSTFHTESLGLGINFLAEHHFAWLLAAWQIEIDRLPSFCEQITVSTWCYDMRRTYALRNFCITDAQGNRCVRADSIWFTFDTQAGKPIRIPASEAPYLTNEPRMDMPPTRRKLSCEGAYQERSPLVVTEQHLDTNRHVNNAQYVLMALQALDQQFVPSRICVQYQQQAHMGDVVIPRVYDLDQSWSVQLCDADGSPYATIELEGRA
jgi:acyl-ACP thioesterase